MSFPQCALKLQYVNMSELYGISLKHLYRLFSLLGFGTKSITVSYQVQCSFGKENDKSATFKVRSKTEV